MATKKTSKPEAAAVRPVKATMTKSALINLLAEQNDIPRKTAAGVFATLEGVFLGSVHPRGVGEFTLPGLLKVTLRKVPARKAGTMIRKLDEAVSLFVRSIEDGRSIGSLDPFGVKTKIAIVIKSAKGLGLSLEVLRKILVQVVKINPDALGDETSILDGYFWGRINKGYFPPKQNTTSR